MKGVNEMNNNFLSRNCFEIFNYDNFNNFRNYENYDNFRNFENYPIYHNNSKKYGNRNKNINDFTSGNFNEYNNLKIQEKVVNIYIKSETKKFMSNTNHISATTKNEINSNLKNEINSLKNLEKNLDKNNDKNYLKNIEKNLENPKLNKKSKLNNLTPSPLLIKRISKFIKKKTMSQANKADLLNLNPPLHTYANNLNFEDSFKLFTGEGDGEGEDAGEFGDGEDVGELRDNKYKNKNKLKDSNNINILKNLNELDEFKRHTQTHSPQQSPSKNSINTNTSIELENQKNHFFKNNTITIKKSKSKEIPQMNQEAKIPKNHSKNKTENKKIERNLNRGNSLNFNSININTENSNSNSTNNINTKNTNSITNTNPNMILNLESLPKYDFNEEFMKYADEFSPSWREECRKINLIKK